MKKYTPHPTVTLENVLKHIQCRLDALETNNHGGYTLKKAIISSECLALTKLYREIIDGSITSNTAFHHIEAGKYTSYVNQVCRSFY